MAKKKSTTNYANNENLLREIILSKQKMKENPKLSATESLTPGLVHLFQRIVFGVSQARCWRNYSYIEDMRSEANLALSQNALKFNEEIGSNPFGYFTQIVWRCFLSYREKEARMGKLRDALLEEQEYMPSFRRQAENEEEQRAYVNYTGNRVEDERKTQEMKSQLQDLINLSIALNKNIEEDILSLSAKLFQFNSLDLVNIMHCTKAIDEKILPSDASWVIDYNVPEGYNVSGLIKLKHDGTTIMRGLKEPAPFADSVIAPYLFLMSIQLRKDTLIKENKSLHERTLRYLSGRSLVKGPIEASMKEVATGTAEPARRGRKPKRID